MTVTSTKESAMPGEPPTADEIAAIRERASSAGADSLLGAYTSAVRGRDRRTLLAALDAVTAERDRLLADHTDIAERIVDRCNVEQGIDECRERCIEIVESILNGG